jgi:hypothetical protein
MLEKQIIVTYLLLPLGKALAILNPHTGSWFYEHTTDVTEGN